MNRKSAEKKVRTIVREELSGLVSIVDDDPLHNANETLAYLATLLSKGDEHVNLSLVRESVRQLQDLIPEISTELSSD